MKKLLVPLLVLLFAAQALASSSGAVLPADEALQLLKDGNARYAAGESKHPHAGADRRAETATGGQHPFATVIGCSDSRQPLEILFDQGVGDLFVIRVAGNVAGASELGSIEYGVGHLGTPVILVLGHTSCGAVTAAVENAKVHGNIPGLIAQIKPAVAKAKSWNPTAGGKEFLNSAIRANVWLSMETILRKSAEVREYVEGGRALLVGGIYDLSSGKVTWLGTHPEQGKILAAIHAAAHRPKPKPKPKPKEEGDQPAEAAPAAATAAEAHPAEKPEAGHGEPSKAVKPGKGGHEEPAKPAKPAKGAKGKAAKDDAPEAANPGGHSEGNGELLAPLDAPAKGKHP
jgi:carbonic anhydrase